MAGELLRARDVLRDGQKVEFYLDEDGDRYQSYIISVSEKELQVAAPKDSTGAELALNPQMVFKALVRMKSSEYQFAVTFLKQETRGRSSLWHTSLPEKVEHSQNRDFVRVSVELPMVVRLISGEGSIGHPQKVRMLDMSGSGLCFEIGEAVEPELQTALEIDSIPEVGTLTVLARVRQCKVVNPKAVYPKYHVGVNFIKLPRATVNRIVRYLFTVQRERIKRASWLRK
jgi:c-di-GMP-binding flagellar brake protein YcgR